MHGRVHGISSRNVTALLLLCWMGNQAARKVKAFTSPEGIALRSSALKNLVSVRC